MKTIKVTIAEFIKNDGIVSPERKVYNKAGNHVGQFVEFMPDNKIKFEADPFTPLSKTWSGSDINLFVEVNCTVHYI